MDFFNHDFCMPSFNWITFRFPNPTGHKDEQYEKIASSINTYWFHFKRVKWNKVQNLKLFKSGYLDLWKGDVHAGLLESRLQG